MTSGGARARSGPPPDPEALRRDRASDPGWIVLPVTGRPGPAPRWPLTDATGRELEHWVRLWVTPQAVMWERLGLGVDVALYVRRLTEAELPGASAALGNHLIRLSEALGLTTAGLRVNRWQVAGEQPLAASAQPQTSGERPAVRRSSRARLKVVPGDGGA